MKAVINYRFEKTLGQGHATHEAIHRATPLRLFVERADDRRLERATAVAALRSAKSEKPDPEKVALKAELAAMRAAIADIGKYLHKLEVQQAPPVSFLDEMMASLQAKPDAVTPTTELSQAYVDALLADE